MARKFTRLVYSAGLAKLIWIWPNPLPLWTEARAMNCATENKAPEFTTTFRPDGTVALSKSTVPDLTSMVVKSSSTLPVLSTTVSLASAKSKTRVSPVAVRSLLTSFRLRCPAVLTPAMSATLITTLSLASAKLPCRVMSGALGALRVKVSAVDVPLSTTIRAVLASLPITFVPTWATVVVAVIPSRIKVAVPLASMLMVMAPLLFPAKVTTPAVSLTVKERIEMALLI